MKLVLFFISLITLQTQASEITPVTVSEISQFRPEWCSSNQIIAQDIKVVCFGSTEFRDIGDVRAIMVERADKTRELFIEQDFSSIDLMTLQFQIVGPVATSKPRSKFAPKTFGQIQLSVDSNGEVESVTGSIRFLEKFFAVRN